MPLRLPHSIPRPPSRALVSRDGRGEVSAAGLHVVDARSGAVEGDLTLTGSERGVGSQAPEMGLRGEGIAVVAGISEETNPTVSPPPFGRGTPARRGLVIVTLLHSYELWRGNRGASAGFPFSSGRRII